MFRELQFLYPILSGYWKYKSNDFNYISGLTMGLISHLFPSQVIRHGWVRSVGASPPTPEPGVTGMVM